MRHGAGGAKSAMRREIRSRLAAMTPQERQEGALAICRALLSQDLWRDARSILLFAALPDEPDVLPLLEVARLAGKQVALPRHVTESDTYDAALVEEPDRDLVAGKYGIREPVRGRPGVPLNRLDLALVPGVAFSPEGWRLGRGKGYYDRLLVQVRGVKCGVGFDCQVVEALPAEPHDVRLNYILTPSRWLPAVWTPRGA